MKAVSGLILILAALPALAGCVSFLNPVSGIQDGEPVPAFLIGEWDVPTLFGKAAAARVSIARGEGRSLLMTVRQEAESEQVRASLWTVGGNQVLSVEAAGGPWNLVALVLDEAGDRVVVKALNLAQVKEDVQQGLLRGEILEFDEGVAPVKVTASREELRRYLEQRSGLFSEELAVLVRRP